VQVQNSTAAKAAGSSARLKSLLYGAVLAPAILLAVCGEAANAGPVDPADFQAYNAANASTIQPGPFALFTVPVDSLLPTQLNEGPAEVGKKTAGFDLETPAQLQADLLTDIEPVVIGPGGKLYLTDGHHTFTALEDSTYGASNPTVFVNVVANYSNLTTAQFFAMMQSQNLLLPLNDGVAVAVNDSTGAPFPSSLTGLSTDPYRGLEYSILKNKSSKLFTTVNNITGAIGASTPGLDKMNGFYEDFFEADAYRGANGGLGLPYLSPGDIALATQWNLNGASITTLPNVSGNVTAAQLPGFILANSITVSGNISNATLANGALDGNGNFTGLTTLNAGTTAEPITIGTPNTGFVLQLGADRGGTVTLTGNNTYTGGTSIMAGTLIVPNDAALGATAGNFTIDPNNIKASVLAANGIVFNSLTEGAGTLEIGPTPGNGTATFTTNRPIAVGGETATINVNGYVVSLTGQLVSLGVGPSNDGLGNAAGESDLTIDDDSTGNNGKLILSQNSPDFYGNIIIGNNGAPTVEVMSDGALGNTVGAADTIGEIDLNSGTLQVGASFAAPERNLFLGSGSQIDVNGFTTSWGNITDVQRTLEVLNSNTTTQGNITFNSLAISATAILQLAGGAAGETVTFTNGISPAADSTLILNPSTATSLGTTEKVFSGTGASSLIDGIAPAWIVTDNGGKKGNGPFDFVTYGANGYVTASYDSTATLNAGTAADVVALTGAATLTGNATVFALNTEGKAVAVGANTLTIGDGTNPAGLILAKNSQINGGTLAFGGSEGVVWLSGTNATISSQITGSNGLTFAGSGTVGISTVANISGPVTIDSGTVTLTAANVFAGDVSGVELDDVKTHPAPATLTIAANNGFSTLNSVGNNSVINITGGSVLTIGDSNNLASTILSSIKDTTATLGAITKDGTGLLDLSGATITLAAGSSIVANAGEIRVATGALKNTAVAGQAPNFTLNNGVDLQFAQSGGGQYAGNISGNGTLHLIGGTLQLTGTNNSYTGGAIVETGSTLDITTANLPTLNANITDAGGLIVFDQATNGNYTGVISDGLEMGTGPLLKGSLDKDDSTGNNTGDVTLTQAQKYTGQTTIEAGTLTLAAVDTLATSSGVDLGRVGGNSTATLALAANNTIQALSSEAGDNTFVTLGANTLTIATPTGTVADFEGVISGTGAVVKSGAGMEILSGANTWSGNTTVQAGALVLTGSISSTGSTTVAGGILDLANHGALTTGTTTVSGGVLELDPGSILTTPTITVGSAGTVFANGGAVRSSGNVTATAFNNSGVLNLRIGAPGNTFTVGAYTGLAGSQLQLGVNFATGASDKLVVTSATGTTAIAVTDTAPNSPLAYNPKGIPVVISATSMSPNAFTLAGGPVQKGLFQYDLAYEADPRFLLVAVPDADAFRLGTIPTAAQFIWLDTAGVWLDRQTDLRDVLLAGIPLAGPTAAQGQAPTGTAPALTNGIWARAVGDFTDRTETQTYSLLNKTYRFQTGYSQDTGAFYAGGDAGKQGVLDPNDAVLFGFTAGYIDSTQDFKGSQTSATYTGGSLGASATYLDRNIFVDVLVKADLLSLSYSDPALTPFGIARQTADVTNIGVIADAGYRFNFGPGFVEPMATLADVSSRVQSMALAGAEVRFGDNSVFRGRFGVRGGATFVDDSNVKVEGTASVSYWGRISGGASATIDSGPGAPLLSVADQQVTNYGEAGLGLNVISKTSGWNGFIKGDYSFASGFTDGSIKGGVRLDF
jgi:fibronectin-binding autotransporter adhesin